MLRSRFCAPEWALFFEVYAGTGWSSGLGRADAVAMNLYPSRGLSVNGFELKVSRSDWLRELKDAAKAETIFGYCDHFWLVVGDRAIVKDGELPEPWGLIAPRGDALAIVKQAPKLKGKPLDREFIAVLARRASTASSEMIEERVAAATVELRALADKLRGERDEALKMSDRHLAAEVKAFEEASGISIRQKWNGGKEVGAMVKALLEVGGIERQKRALERLAETARVIRHDCAEALKVLP